MSGNSQLCNNADLIESRCVVKIYLEVGGFSIQTLSTKSIISADSAIYITYFHFSSSDAFKILVYSFVGR